MSDYNGILASVPGEYIAEAINALPDAETAEDRDYEVVLEAGHVGMVRLYACRKKARHGKHTHWFWSVHRAESV